LKDPIRSRENAQQQSTDGITYGKFAKMLPLR